MPRIADRVAETTTTTGTGTLTLAGAKTGCLTFAAALAGEQTYYAIAGGSEWEVGAGTVSGSTLTRDTVLASSNAGSLVSFSAGTKDVFCTMPALALSGGAVSIPYAAAIKFTGQAQMAQTTVTGAIAFTAVTTGAVDGATVQLDLIANGTNSPTFDSAFREWDGSSGYVNVLNVRNCITFFRRAGIYYYSINQQYGAAADPVPATAITLSGPSSGVINVASGAFTVAANGVITGSIVVTPAATGGGNFSPTSVTISAGSPTATFTYTPTTAGSKTVSVTNSGGLSNPSSISYTANATGYTLVANGAGVATTSAINSTGADFIVIGISGFTGLTPTDSKGNTWTALTTSTSAGPGSTTARLFYCKTPTVGSGHTFSSSGAAASSSAIFAIAFSGSGATPFSAEAGAVTTSASSLAAGSVTPAQANSLLISMLAEGPTLTSPSINTGFTVSNAVAGVVGTSYGGAMAYEIQGAATARNATWSWSSGAEEAATRMAVFK